MASVAPSPWPPNRCASIALAEEPLQPRAPAEALCVTEIGSQPCATHVLIRGNPHAQGELVEPGFLSVLNVPDPVLPPPPANGVTSGRRLVLARWLASPENPLTARVMANRVWQYHFGRGLVRLAEQFRFCGRGADAPRVARLAGLRVDRRGLAAQIAS